MNGRPLPAAHPPEAARCCVTPPMRRYTYSLAVSTCGPSPPLTCSPIGMGLVTIGFVERIPERGLLPQRRRPIDVAGPTPNLGIRLLAGNCPCLLSGRKAAPHSKPRSISYIKYLTFKVECDKVSPHHLYGYDSLRESGRAWLQNPNSRYRKQSAWRRSQ